MVEIGLDSSLSKSVCPLNKWGYKFDLWPHNLCSDLGHKMVYSAICPLPLNQAKQLSFIQAHVYGFDTIFGQFHFISFQENLLTKAELQTLT